MRAELRKRVALLVLAVGLAAGAGLAIGFSLRRPEERVEPSQAFEDEEVAGASGAQTGENATRPESARRSALARQLEEDLSMSDPVTHWLYWLDAIEKANLADMPSLAVASGGDATLQRMIGERWMEMDPRNLFDWLIAREGMSGGVNLAPLGQWFRREWAKRDPEALIEALREAPAFGQRGSWRTSVATTIVQTDPELGLRLVHEWNIENYGPGTKGIAKWAAENPKHAAEFALAHPAGYATQHTMGMIGTEWAKLDPAEALTWATSGRDEQGWKSMLAETAMKGWAENDLAKAGEWLAGAEESVRDKLSAPLVEAWAKKDPAHALVWCEENLAGTALKQAARGVLKGAAEKDVAMAARLVLVMEPGATRAEGAIAVAEEWLPDTFSGKSMPGQAVDWLRKLDSASRRQVLREVHWRWAGTDPKSIAEFLAELKDPDMPEEVYSSVVTHLARHYPIEAIEWGGKLPEQARESVSRQAFNAWRGYQPEPAMKWLTDLPENDPRRLPLFESAVREMARFDRGAADQFAVWPPELRATARQVVERIGLPAEKKETLLKALD